MAVTSEVDSNPEAEAEAKRKPSLNKTNIEHFCQHFRWFKDAASIKKNVGDTRTLNSDGEASRTVIRPASHQTPPTHF